MSEQDIQDWLNGPIDTESKSQIRALMRDDPKSLEEAFSTRLKFGTGGMRGLMGVGTNRINLYTIQMATQGLASYLLKQPLKYDHYSVFISYDCRHNSKLFALEAARVLAGNSITAYLTFELRPTPYVSFGVRQKECSAGIMITASHNPKEYNGYKVYWSDGAQVVAPHDKAIVSEVEKIKSFDQIKLAPKNSPLIEIVDAEFDLEYLDTIKKLQIDPKEDQKVGDQLKITFTPLHGTGNKLVPAALRRWGFTNINLVEHQIVPDGNFPTVSSPNPESPEALEMGIKQLESTLSDILIATDPDADRMAALALHNDKAHMLNGNQIACICLEYICQMLKLQGRLPENGAAVTTIVSTDLFSKIAKAHNIACFEVLTGFKYIGELIHKWELDNSHTFLFGAEESYGYLMGTHSRDKDAIVISCLIAEIALLMKVEGRTLVDFLNDIYKKYGLYLEKQKVIEFPPGTIGMDQMNALMDKLRNSPPSSFMGLRILAYEDYLRGFNHLPPSNVLLYRLEEGSKIIIRPSGTEPKLKIYASVHEPQFEKGMSFLEDKIEQLLHAASALL